MKCHHPDVFCAALLNAQPMGLYAAAQIVRDAREHGVEVRPVCVNFSRWDCTLEPADGRLLAVRLGLRMVKGLSNAHAAKIVAGRGDDRFDSVDEVWRRTGVSPSALHLLAEADGFRGMRLDRRSALWAVRGLREEVLPLFAAADKERRPQPEIVEPVVPIAPMLAGRNVVEDYETVGLTLRQHPVAFIRGELAEQRIIPCRGLLAARDGQRLTVAGLVLVRQRPGTATGVVFITIEDETGIANLVVWCSQFERQRRIVLSTSMLACRGRVQREGDVIHVVTEQLDDLSGLLKSVGGRDAPFPLRHGRGDEVTHQNGPDPREEGAYPPSSRRNTKAAISDSKGIKIRTRDFR
jgi:error-prone DNA polymerase